MVHRVSLREYSEMGTVLWEYPPDIDDRDFPSGQFGANTPDHTKQARGIWSSFRHCWEDANGDCIEGLIVDGENYKPWMDYSKAHTNILYTESDLMNGQGLILEDIIHDKT